MICFYDIFIMYSDGLYQWVYLGQEAAITWYNIQEEYT